jgi:hypothetical protein
VPRDVILEDGMANSGSLTESPFLDVRSFEAPSERVISRLGLSSPFVEAFAFEHIESNGDPRSAMRRVLLAELYDEEFDDAVYEFVGETAAFSGGNGDARLGMASAKLRLAPLVDEIEAYIQRAADEFGSRDVATITETEIDNVFGRAGSERQLAPVFENLFGSITKAISKVAKGAVNLAKKGIDAATKLGLGPLLDKLKQLVRPLLERVLKAAINRLPASVQPAATKLANKLPVLFGKELASNETEEPAVDIGAIQSEFNEKAVDLLLGGTDPEADQEASWGEPDVMSEVGIGDLDAARQRFIGDLEQLGDGEDPGPAVERFVPALLPVVKLGIRLAGRKRVVGLLSDLVSKLISRFVGPASSGALSTALVDAGFKLLGLEVSDTDQRRAASAALAATVEETLRRVAALPEAVLDNEMLLEGSVLRAFEQAAASNLPPLLPATVYRLRPELVETDSRRGTWISCPIRGPKRYKKFSRIIKTRITPHSAMTVTTFGEAPLAQFLQEQLGMEPGEEVEAELHIYESLPGTLLGEVARLEANGNGAASIVEFHPLTREAAALLVQEPGLARPMSSAGGSAPKDLAVGQRFYRVAVPGRRVAAIPGVKGRPRRRTSLHTVLNFPGDRIRLRLFLSERRAQEVATALRKQGHAGAVVTTVANFIERGLAAATDGNVSGHIRIVHEALSLDEARGAGLSRLPKSAVQAFASRIGEWTLTALTDYFSKQAASFIAATEDAKDGVTLIITLANAPGMAAMRKALAGAPVNGEPGLAGAPASVQVDVVPGFTDA